MCGLAGVLGSFLETQTNTVGKMADAIFQRGPDDAGIWVDADAGIALAHRRLSIVDLSQAGHQPMSSATERFVIVYNGEIYNHLKIRNELEELNLAPKWCGHSDTETLLAGFEAWGIEATLRKSIGMFSIALWDRQERMLTLARDRMGEKPLYYGWQGSAEQRCFLFGSELKALKVHPAFSAEVDRGSLCLLLRHNYIPAPYSIYQGISKLKPGSLLTVSLDQPEPAIWKYWDTLEVACAGIKNQYKGSADSAVDVLEQLAQDAVSQQMIADVPLGAFLSGGIDSSTVVALMQVQSSRPVKTFTIGFNDESYNEAVYAKAVAQHLGTDHTELYVTPEQAMDIIPRLSSLYCEPFADSSQIPTFLVSQLARQQVKVSLSGDAGDELFSGYNRYEVTSKLWSRLSIVPSSLRALSAKGITSISPGMWDRLARFIPGAAQFSLVGDKLHKGANVMTSRTADDLYLGMVSHLNNPEEWVIGGKEPLTELSHHHSKLNGLNTVERMMALDAISYLPDDILVKVDRAAMGVSLESRVPLLDHRIVEFAWSLPLGYKLREGQTKWPLRQVLYRHVPRELIDRPKMGFGIPLHDWLRGPLRNWSEALLDEDRLTREGYFQPTPIRQKWTEHLSGRHNWASQLWNVLMFQAWLESNTE